ncbi:TRAP transporter large permease subunit [Alphaproteobacteria bacterium KMM 3653]|uniref:TRAP transporter large permease protein n=1 Tax=Harenicola maris TaxID=2841044 RepID=A0AAP2CRB8_9RHOB|nr:TRAP transporter large permease subunit [Harenicola maris]
MTGIEIGIISLVVMVVLIYLGMHVAISLAAVSFVAIWVFKGNATIAISLLTIAAKDTVASYSFGVVPLFVLMGLFVTKANLGRDIYAVANAAFRRLDGGLGVATVAANAIFAAITGISIASAAIFTRIAVPEMVRYGHTPRFAVGVVAGSSVLGMLIPPSVLLIIYALIAEVSIAHMFTAGILPGIVLAFLFCMLILMMCRFAPGFTGRVERLVDEERLGLFNGVKLLAPSVLLIAVVLGGIYGGVFTPTEAGAAGAFCAMVIALAKRSLDLRGFWNILTDAGQTTASILFLIIAASMYSRMLGVSGIPSQLSSFVGSLDAGFAFILLIYILLMIFLGTILDSTSIILVLVPLFLPIFADYDVNLIWLGIITVLGVEIGLLTPPLGIACFVIKGSLEDKSISLADIFIGAFPFALAMVLGLLIVIFFPWLTLH